MVLSTPGLLMLTGNQGTQMLPQVCSKRWLGEGWRSLPKSIDASVLLMLVKTKCHRCSGPELLGSCGGKWSNVKKYNV